MLQKTLPFLSCFNTLLAVAHTQKHRGKSNGIPFLGKSWEEGSVQLATGSFLWLAGECYPGLVAFAD